MSVDLSTRLWDPLGSLLYYFVRTQLYLSFFYVVSSSHKLCGQLKVRLLLCPCFHLVCSHSPLEILDDDDDGFQDFQAYSLGEIQWNTFLRF